MEKTMNGTTVQSMTGEDIRKTAAPMAVWMADATIREARRGITGNTGWPKPKRSDYNLPEVEMAGEILFRMFNTYSAAIKTALINMPAEMDGIYSFHGRSYLDEFVKALDAYHKKNPAARPVQLREPDWILDGILKGE